jgi:hypothetical protein
MNTFKKILVTIAAAATLGGTALTSTQASAWCGDYGYSSYSPSYGYGYYGYSPSYGYGSYGYNSYGYDHHGFGGHDHGGFHRH